MAKDGLKLTNLQGNLKGINFDAWGGIEVFLRETSTGAGGTAKPQLLRRVVPWLAKANDMTGLAVAQLPFEIVNEKGDVFDTSSDWKNKLGGIDSPDKFLYRLASSLCLGKAYVIPEYTSRQIIDLHYCAPHTVVPLITVNGLQQFSRTSDYGQSGTYFPAGLYDTLEVDQMRKQYTGEMIYFWLHDSDIEIGPPKSFPAGAALLASELLTAMGATLQTVSERGFVPPTLLSVKGMIGQGEREKTEVWYNRFLRRWSDSVAKIINAETMDIKIIGAGMADLKGVYSELQKQSIEDIGTAYGIPAALFMSDMAFASEVNPLIKIWYSTSVFIKIYHTIETTLNEQLLDKFGLKWRFKPEMLDAFQANEKERSENYYRYRQSGIKPSIAAQMVGMEMPPGVEYADLDDEPQPGKLEPTAQQDAAQAQFIEAAQAKQPQPVAMNAAMTKDLNLWRQTATRFYKKGKGTMSDFECKALPEAMAAPIRAKLAAATNELEIIKSFEIGETIEVETRTDDYSGLKALANSIDAAMEKLHD